MSSSGRKRRSPVSSVGSASPAAAAAGWGAAVPTWAPQLKQNLAPPGSSVRQLAQLRAVAAPHDMQNLAPVGFSVPHVLQSMRRRS